MRKLTSLRLEDGVAHMHRSACCRGSRAITRGCGHSPMKLSIVLPVLNEAQQLPQVLECLRPARERGVEVIIVDGGSEDGTLSIAARAGARLVNSPKGLPWSTSSVAHRTIQQVDALRWSLHVAAMVN